MTGGKIIQRNMSYSDSGRSIVEPVLQQICVVQFGPGSRPGGYETIQTSECM